MPNEPILEVRNLKVYFRKRNEETRAVDDVSFSVFKGETLAIVGESGSGKSVSALSLTRLVPSPPAVYAGGQILLSGVDTLKMGPNQLRKIRGGKIAYIFQEPGSSLNPVFTIRNQIAEAIRLHRPEVKDVDKEIIRFLGLVGIQNPESRLHSYPHQYSGGMQQRVMIAMALACEPEILVADEPTTALDVTIQAQIIALLKELKAKLGMTIVLITHNFGIVADIAERVIVMFRGKIVETGTTQEVLKNPQHPYTRALIDCIPKLGMNQQRLRTIDYSTLS